MKCLKQSQRVRSKSWVLYMQSTPCKEWAKHLSHLSSQTPEHTPVLTPSKEQACPPPQGAGKQGNLFVLTPHCYSRGPNKALPNLLVWPPVNFCCLRRARITFSNSLRARTQALGKPKTGNWGSRHRDADCINSIQVRPLHHVGTRIQARKQETREALLWYKK